MAREILERMKELGVPDWRTPEGYPKPRELEEFEWHWEFLRRSPKYRADYNRVDKTFEESKARYFERVYGMRTVANPRYSAMERRDFGKDDPLCPGPSIETLFRSDLLRTKYAPFCEIKERFESDLKPSHLFLRVDLEAPLKPQFGELYAFAIQCQRSWNNGKPVAKRPQELKWPLYLRVLDARGCGASFSQIAKILPKTRARTPQAARDVAKQAAALRDNWA